VTPRQRTTVLSRLQSRGRAAGELLDAMHIDARRLEDVALACAVMAAIEFLDAARYAVRERILLDAGHAPPPHGHVGPWRVDYMTEAEADAVEGRACLRRQLPLDDESFSNDAPGRKPLADERPDD
jgi:hypothetical protein